MPRPATPEGELTPAARRVLDTAAELFYRQGIRAVGVEAIAEAAGVTKKTLYDRFGSKDELVAAYLRAREERWRVFLTGYLDEHARVPRERLLMTFDALAEWLQHDGTRGCSAINAHAELPETDHPGRLVVTENKQWMLSLLADLAGQAGADEPDAVAADLLLLHEGAAVTAPMGTVDQPLRRARRVAEGLVPRS